MCKVGAPKNLEDYQTLAGDRTLSFDDNPVVMMFAWRFENSPALGAGRAAQRVLQGHATIVLTSLSLTLTFFILSSA